MPTNMNPKKVFQMHLKMLIIYSDPLASDRWGHSRVFALKSQEERIKGSCEHGDYKQEAEQIQPGHKLLNGKLVRNPDLNSPITEEKIGKK